MFLQGARGLRLHAVEQLQLRARRVDAGPDNQQEGAGMDRSHVFQTGVINRCVLARALQQPRSLPRPTPSSRHENNRASHGVRARLVCREHGGVRF